METDTIGSYHETNLLDAIKQSFIAYEGYGPHSPAKLKPLHAEVAKIMSAIWGDEFDIHHLGSDSGEFKVDGKYYPKDIDIVVTKNNVPIYCVGIKFVTSNYKQNANNYFENMLGETANIQALNGLPYGQLLLLRHQTPYYKKNETGTPSKIETINDHDIQKYLNLFFDVAQAHKPQHLGILIIDIDETTSSISPTNIKSNFSEPIAHLLEESISLQYFFKGIHEYKTFLSTPK